MTRDEALAKGYKVEGIETIGILRGKAFDLSQHLRGLGSTLQPLAASVHDALCLALPEDGRTPLCPADRPASCELQSFPAAIRLLRNVADVIDMTDPDHENFADSAADTVQALCELEPAIRKLLALAEKVPADG